MPITPDTKDWTWVTQRRCPECDFDASAISPGEVAALLRDNVARWVVFLAERGPEALRQRPSDDRWSDLEYACHVRDVYRLYDYRLHLMLDEDDPLFPNWDQDEAAIAERYNEQDPSEVARELQQVGETLVSSFDAVPDNAWSRKGRRSDGASFTIDTFARYMVHDPIHHLWDVS